ncbi:MAG: aminotransferase class III-fold pyridoxal phosphate-dependent enzyme [Acidobacteriota bacterium]|nr:aminotransferase class III-fold pyridoxal phosphate-dependent enzyme [Acidobacteriota bacterium]
MTASPEEAPFFRYPDSSVFYRDLERTYRVAKRAAGAWIEADDGSRWLDACGGALTISVGHGRPEVVQAAADQLSDVAYVHGTQFTTPAMEEAAASLVDSLPPAYRDAKVYLTPGGAEAVETAIKLARAHALAGGHPERHRIVSQRPGYHGNTLGALAVSGRDALRAPYLPLLADMPLVAAPWCPRCPLGLRYPECEVACASEVDRAVESAEGSAAAVLVEPVLGASAGGFAPPEDYLRSVRRTTAEAGVLLIADEVLSGCGRTGRFLASEHAGVDADIVVLGKGLTSGFLPGGAVVAKPEVVEAVAPDFRHGFTFSHHPVVAAVVLEVLRVIRDEGLVARAASLEDAFRTALEPLGGEPAVEGWWVRGLLAGIALRPESAGGRSARQFAASAWERGLLVYPVGGPEGQGDLVVLAPPLTIPRDDLAEIGRRLLSAFS